MSQENLNTQLAEALARLQALENENASLKAAKSQPRAKGGLLAHVPSMDFTNKDGVKTRTTVETHILAQGGPWVTVAYVVEERNKRSVVLRKLQWRKDSKTGSMRFHVASSFSFKNAELLATALQIAKGAGLVTDEATKALESPTE